MSTSLEQVDDELMQLFIQSLSQPEASLMPLFWPGENEASLHSRRHELRLVCLTLFQKVEGLAKAYDSLTNSETPIVLSGLEELYIGTDDQPVDAETLWGQAELQNEALHSLLKSLLKKVSKAVDTDDDQQVRLLEMGDILSDKEDESAEDEEHEGSQGDEESVDEETKRIRARMERAMADMESSDEDNGDDELEEEENDEMEDEDNNDGGTKDKGDDESLEDPAAEKLNDGFFDIAEMEEFADVEEDYLPEEAFGAVQPEEDEDEPKKSFHQRQRDGDVDSGTDEDDDDDDELAFNKATESTVRRKKYRQDDEIEALYSLYSNVQDDDDDEDDDDDVVNMTAADFFGKPNKKYFDKFKSKSKTKSADDDGDADSWDDQDFDAEGPGWRDEQSKGKKVTFGNDKIEEYDDQEEVEEDGEENDEPEKKITPSSSSHARHAEKLRRQTEQLEKDLLAEKPWQMTGESKSSSRPVNSLLEATPEFEVATKMAPLITVEHTANLEEVIKRRVLDEDWDDVIPRELPDVAWNKKRGELPEVSQEKSKLGLGELYEREYLKKAVGYDVDAAEKETDEEKARNEMKALFANLCSKLDALSNYHFAPRPVADEAEVRAVTTPAIAMEEVLPLHVSDARGVAPEEVYGSKKGRDGILRGDCELDQAERKRLRGAKKAARRKARKEKLADEKLLSKLQPGLGLNNPYEKRKMREELSMARSKGRVTTGERDVDAEYGASGKKFFKRMQEEVEQSVHPDGDNTKKKRKHSHDGSTKKSSAFKL